MADHRAGVPEDVGEGLGRQHGENGVRLDKRTDRRKGMGNRQLTG